MLCLHIPSLHPATFMELELEVPAVVQIAALMGVGLLYQVPSPLSECSNFSTVFLQQGLAHI